MFLKRWTKHSKHKTSDLRQAGNAIVMLFAAIGMAGVVTYGLNNVMRGPASMTSEVSRRTIAENNLVASTRLAIAAAANQPDNGDCDRDGFVEPVPFRDAGGAPAPVGGGLIPMTIGASLSDPWSTQYGYCVWDPGTLRVSDNVAACGGSTAKRLEGSKRDDQPAIAIISAGPNGAFETTCAAFVDTTPADNLPDTPMISKANGSDDIVLSYTYAEANGIGGGMWKLKVDPLDPADKSTAEIARDLTIKGGTGGTFSGAVELKNKGLRLPADPGDDSVTGACDESKSNELRTNISTSPPSVEICDFPNGSGWVPIGGGAGEAFDPTKANCTANTGGPLVQKAFLSGSFSPERIRTGTGIDGNQAVFYNNTATRVGTYNFTGTSFTPSAVDTSGSNTSGLFVTKNYIFADRGSDGELAAFTYDGAALSKKASFIPSAPVQGSYGIWVNQNGIVFVPRENSVTTKYNIYAYSFNGTNFTQIAVSPDIQGGISSFWGKGSYIISASLGKTDILNFDGTSFTLLYTVASGTGSQALTWDSNYLYMGDASSFNVLQAYSFDGTTLTPVQSYTAAGNIVNMWGDGTHIYVARNTGILEVLKFNGTSFTQVDSVTGLGSGGRVWGDGNYIYWWSSTGFRAFSGFECTSPDPSGGAAPPEAAETPINTTPIPDPLDAGLVSYWKMDEGSGTTVKDSVGTNDGTFTNTPLWVGGAKGTNGLSFGMSNNGTTRDAVSSASLLGNPSEGTIALWVNNIEGNGANATLSSHFFSVGEYVTLKDSANGKGLTFSYYTGSGTSSVESNYSILGKGWQYVVATFDNANNIFRLYLNGTMLKEENYTTDVTWTGQGSSTWFGRHGNGNTTYDFYGSLDDVRFYNRALSPDEVMRLSKRSGIEARIPQQAQFTATTDAYRNIIGQGMDAYACGIKPDTSLWCWGGVQAVTNTSKMMYDLPPGGGIASISSIPLRMRDTTSEYYYFLPASTSDIAGGYAMGGVVGVGANFALAASSTSNISFYTPAGSPSGFVPGPTSIFFNVSSGAIAGLYGSIHMQRVSSAGMPKSPEKEFGVEATISANGVYRWYGEMDLGTWQPGDRLKVTLKLRNTGAATTLGLSSGTSTAIRFPTSEIDLPGWAQVSSGLRHACGIRIDGEAWCWGIASTALGNPTPGTGLTPVKVSEPGPWTDIDSGDGFSCAIKADGAAWCWGAATNYRTGNGTSSPVGHVPTLISGGAKWVDLDVSSAYGCGIQIDGSLWCWGSDAYGQQGNGDASTVDQSVPAEIVEKGPWHMVSTGQRVACAIKKDGSAWCWGSNEGGSLGNGSSLTTNFESPVRVVDPGPWSTLSVGTGAGSNAWQRETVCGIKLDGSTWCWGGGWSGSLGNGTNGNITSTVPVKVNLPTAAVAVTNGLNANCATLIDRSVWCWGYNARGHLGNGTLTSSPSPVPVIGFPNAPAWEYNDLSTHIMPSLNANIALRESWLSDDGTARGFGFISPGSAVLKHPVNTQLFLDSTAASTSAQVSFSTSPTSGYADVTSGLVGRWVLDASSGTAVAAATGTAGTVTGTSVSWAPGFGKISGAAYFNGNAETESFISINRSAAIETAAVSIAFWMNRGIDNGGISTMISKAHTDNTGAVAKSYAVGMDQYGSSRITFTTGNTGGNDVLKSAQKIPAGQWVHVVATYDPAGNAPQKRLYINGALDSSTARTNALVYTANATGNLFFGQGGCAAASACERYEGFLDEARIYNRALTPAEISSLYANQSAAYHTPRSIGIDEVTNHLEFGVNAAGATSWMNAISGQMQITSSGNIQIGSGVSPDSMLSVAGGVRIGSQVTCGASNAGAMRYNGGTPMWQYCNGTTWTGFPNASPIVAPWKKGQGALALYAWGPSCAIKADGSLWCWSRGQYGSLGINADTVSFVPVQVHSDSSSTGWSDWRYVTVGTNSACGIRSDGTAWCWGNNVNGRLGIGTTAVVEEWRPVQVQTSTGPGGWSDWKKIAGGDDGKFCGIRSDGTAWCWGGGLYGQAGNNATTSNVTRPVQVHSDSSSTGWTDWVDIATSRNRTCGVRTNGTAWCWGWGTYGALGNNQVGTNSLRPTEVHSDSSSTGWTDWVQLDGGVTGMCGLRSNGTLWCWGRDSCQLGNNQNTSTDYMRPIQVHSDSSSTGWTDWTSVSMGTSYACGIRSNGTLWCWGNGTNGKLGNNATSNQCRPVQVHSDTSSTGWTDWVTVGTGDKQTCGIRANGTLWCWGGAEYGRVGDGQDTTDRLRPVQVN